jgi:hypothetical protein
MPAWTNRVAMLYNSHHISLYEARDMLSARDLDLQLEMDSSHPLGFCADVLASVFPEAKFIVTVRDPVTWIRSRIKYHHAVNPPAWREFRNHFWACQPGSFRIEDMFLKPLGLCSVDQYFQAYEEQYRHIWNNMPYSQMLVIKTEDLGTQLGFKRIADFLDIPVNTLVYNHSNRCPVPEDITTPLEDAWLRSRAEELCPKAYEFYNVIA